MVREHVRRRTTNSEERKKSQGLKPSNQLLALGSLLTPFCFVNSLEKVCQTLE